MTTRIKITNEGPENAGVWYYDEQRQFKQHKDVLKPGESIEIHIWNGHLPVVLPLGNATNNGPAKTYAVPPATY